MKYEIYRLQDERERSRPEKAYFRESESSTDSFLVFANCRTEEVPRLFSDIGWVYDPECNCPIALETPAS